jgi:hypothetical protein
MMNPQPITIQQLYPQLAGTELKIAEENLGQYLALVLRIYTRLEQSRMLDVCQRQIEMSYSLPNRNVRFLSGVSGEDC